ncbi:unnamed protein product [Ixodes pacificus]
MCTSDRPTCFSRQVTHNGHQRRDMTTSAHKHQRFKS